MTFAGKVFQAVSDKRMSLWLEKVKEVNWELFDRGVEAYTFAALEQLIKGAGERALLHAEPKSAEAERLRDELKKPFAARVFFWPRQSGPRGDLVDDEMGRVLQ